MQSRPVLLLALAGSAVLGATIWAWTREVPFLGDSCAWLAAVSEFDSPLRAFDPGLALFRPLQHLILWVLVHTGLDRLDTARIPGLLLHMGFVLAVLRLGRTLGLGPRGQFAAGMTILAFPCVQTLHWIAGMSTPGRALCTVLAVDAAVRHARVPRSASGLAMLGWSLASMLWHEQGVVTAGLAAIAWWRLRTAGARRLDPWVLSALAVSTAWFAIVLLRPSRGHGLKDLASLPANVAHALTAFLPADLRLFVLDALRSHGGVAGITLLAIAVTVALVAWKSQRLGRTLLLLAALDCLLPLLSTGFGQRYAYCAAAFVALTIGSIWNGWTGLGRIRRTALVSMSCVLWLGWLYDGWRDLDDVREGGATVSAVAADAIAVRTGEPGVLLLLVDLPSFSGRERSVGLFGWGGRELLHRLGVAPPLRCVRTEAWFGGTDVELVDLATIAQAAQAGAIALRFAAHRPGLVRMNP